MYNQILIYNLWYLLMLCFWRLKIHFHQLNRLIIETLIISSLIFFQHWNFLYLHLSFLRKKKIWKRFVSGEILSLRGWLCGWSFGVDIRNYQSPASVILSLLCLQLTHHYQYQWQPVLYQAEVSMKEPPHG